MKFPITSHKQKKCVRRREWSYFLMGLEKLYKVSHFRTEGEIQWSLKRRGEVCWSLKRRERPAGHSSRPVISSCVFSGRRTTSQKGSPRYVRTLSNCIPTLHASPSKNKNIDYMVIYLRVLRCLSCGSIYATR